MNSIEAGCGTPCAPNGQRHHATPAVKDFDQSLLTSAPTMSDAKAFATLALLSPANYDRVRKHEAKRLGIRVETLDSEVTCVRAEAREEAMFQSALSTLNSPELSTTDLEKDLCRQLARWAADNFDALKACEPVLPPTAFNRLADNWRPLFAIAQIAGADWPERVLAAFNHLTRQTASASALDHRESTLLAAISDVFRLAGTDRLTTKQLLAALQTAPKLNAHGLVPRSALELGRRLAPYGIESITVRAGKERGKGYYLADFPAEAATRVDSTATAVDFEI